MFHVCMFADIILHCQRIFFYVMNGKRREIPFTPPERELR